MCVAPNAAGCRVATRSGIPACIYTYIIYVRTYVPTTTAASKNTAHAVNITESEQVYTYNILSLPNGKLEDVLDTSTHAEEAEAHEASTWCCFGTWTLKQAGRWCRDGCLGPREV